jgi:hypothetical protein
MIKSRKLNLKSLRTLSIPCASFLIMMRMLSLSITILKRFFKHLMLSRVVVLYPHLKYPRYPVNLLARRPESFPVTI